MYAVSTQEKSFTYQERKKEKKGKIDMVLYIYNLRTRESEAGGLLRV